MRYKIKAACKSDIGLIRQKNEDNFFFNNKVMPEVNNGSRLQRKKWKNNTLVGVALFDGLGGETKGERASFLAAKSFQEYIKNTKNFNWIDYINLANKKIIDVSNQNTVMATTMAGVLFTLDSISICNLGDSRIYALKDHKLKQLSVDHTDEFFQKKMKKNFKKKHLTQHLGISDEYFQFAPHVKQYTYSDFTHLLICSDGLSDMLSDEEIEEVLNEDKSVNIITEKLVSLALDKGGQDNITIILMEISLIRRNIFKIIGVILFFIIMILISFNIFKNDEFVLIEDGYKESLLVNESFNLEYKGDAKVVLSNDLAEYKDGKIIALAEGKCIIRIIDEEEVLYEKIIKIFPNKGV